jgi:hypothetical protein
MRCNNRAFNLGSRESREILLYTLNRAKQKYDFKIFGLCIMLNHVHYVIQPATAEELPKIMHWINWYSAMWKTLARDIKPDRAHCIYGMLPAQLRTQSNLLLIPTPMYPPGFSPYTVSENRVRWGKTVYCRSRLPGISIATPWDLDRDSRLFFGKPSAAFRKT